MNATNYIQPARYAIKSGREYLRTFDPVSGWATYTHDASEAKTFSTYELAAQYALYGEKVVALA